MKVKDFSAIRNNGSLPSPKEIQVPIRAEEFLNDFVVSMVSSLEELEAAVLAYEAGGSYEENAASARRILHSIKGEAGILGIDDIYEFCHQAESAMEDLDQEEKPIMLLKAKDWLDAALQHITGEATSASRANTSECCLSDEYEAKHEERTESRSRLRILIVEDDFASRKALQVLLSEYGDCLVAVNGTEAVEAFKDALDTQMPYDLICLDIIMPQMDGHDALKAIRQIEDEHRIYGLDGVKIIMATAKDDSKNIIGAFREGCEAYIIKPVLKEKLFDQIKKLGLVK